MPVSRLNAVPGDAGVRGAELAVKDNNTAVALIEQIADDAAGLVLVDASAERLLALADAARGKPCCCSISTRPTRGCAKKIAVQMSSISRLAARC